MQNGSDFYIIDMALAKDSALKECVPEGLIRLQEEDWIRDRRKKWTIIELNGIGRSLAKGRILLKLCIRYIVRLYPAAR